MPSMVTRPVITSIADAIRWNWRHVVAGTWGCRHWQSATIDIIGDSVYLLYANLYDLTRQTARVRGRDRPDARRVCASPAGFCCGLCRTLSVRQDLARQGAPTPERWRRQRRFAAYGRQAVLHPGLPEDQSAANDARVAIRAESTAEPLLDSSLAPCPETCLSRARRGAGTRCEPGRH